MNMTRRQFGATVATGAVAAACGGIAEARKEEAGLKVGDEVIFIGQREELCDCVSRYSIGDVFVVSDIVAGGAVVDIGESSPGWRRFICASSLVRVLDGPLEVGDRVYLHDAQMKGRVVSGTKYSWLFADLDQEGLRYFGPVEDFTKIEELS